MGKLQGWSLSGTAGNSWGGMGGMGSGAPRVLVLGCPCRDVVALQPLGASRARFWGVPSRDVAAVPPRMEPGASRARFWGVLCRDVSPPRWLCLFPNSSSLLEFPGSFLVGIPTGMQQPLIPAAGQGGRDRGQGVLSPSLLLPKSSQDRAVPTLQLPTGTVRGSLRGQGLLSPCQRDQAPPCAHPSVTHGDRGRQ